MPDLLTDVEVRIAQSRKTFVERYINWACQLTDAPRQYHESGAFILLSALLAGSVRLPTSFGSIIPNLWFMILGPSTITRKTVSMNLAMRLLYDVDDRALLATDGSVEGILVGMRDRPRQPSIFLRDEFTGLLEAIAHRDYMAGFAEQLTKLYDGEALKRLLRKETIDIRDPIFIMYVGGIKSKTQMMITEDLVMGGFLPRFIIISGEADINNMKEMGPPRETFDDGRDIIKNELIDMFNHYSKETRVSRNGESLGKVKNEYLVELTKDAWKRYNEYERELMQTALNTGLDYLIPTYDRLAKSTLKVSMLLAASTQRDDKVIVDVEDIIHAIYYAKNWREHMNEVVGGIGKTFDERIMDRIYYTVAQAQFGASRADIMNIFHLDAKKADLMLKTMEQRQMISLTDVNGERRYKIYG